MLGKYLKKSWRKFIRCIFLSCLVVAFQVCIPVISRNLLSRLGADISIQYIVKNFIVYGVALLALNIVSVIWYQALDSFGGDLLSNIRNDLFESLFYAPYNHITHIGKEKLKNIIFFDTINLFSSLSVQMVSLITNLLGILIFLTITFRYERSIGFILVLVMIGGFLISYISRNKIVDASKKVNLCLKKQMRFPTNM